MPVINIPESELAYNAFFSLHRPLLGLSGEEEFFVVKMTPEEALFEEINEYMMGLEAFVPPSPAKK
ncbi:hypothetical protein K501DRAFT_285922 [Backusella circina FSU 941]|nr:hypothetical protein K501DRAFT_285922 [Backusella circina FSU 941]